jgi:hypothetical protein
MVRLIGGLAGAALAALPAGIYPDWRVAAAGGMAGFISAIGVLLPSLGMATAGAVLALLVFAVALVATPAGGAVPEAAAMGAAVLIVLDLAHFRRRFRGASIDPGVAPVHLASLALSVAVGAGAAAALLGLVALLPAAPGAMLRPVLAAGGGLLAYTVAIWAFARPS